MAIYPPQSRFSKPSNSAFSSASSACRANHPHPARSSSKIISIKLERGVERRRKPRYRLKLLDSKTDEKHATIRNEPKKLKDAKRSTPLGQSPQLWKLI